MANPLKEVLARARTERFGTKAAEEPDPTGGRDLPEGETEWEADERTGPDWGDVSKDTRDWRRNLKRPDGGSRGTPTARG